MAFLLVQSLPAAPSSDFLAPQQRYQTTILHENNQAPYYWKAQSAGEDAQLLTLFCRSCQGPANGQPSISGGVPLVSVLRDTLGDSGVTNDRVTSIWLLTYTRPTLGRRILSAVPFFYWRVGGKSVDTRAPKPLMNLLAPRHPAIAAVGRQIVQWSALDPAAMPVRATSRSYGSNQADNERLHLEEAINYLRSAPASNNPSDLTQNELDTVMARLELRKKLLGGFVKDANAATLGEAAGFEDERIRVRNWELLRQCADKTNLVFEPLSLADTSEQYAIVWYPVSAGAREPVAPGLGPIWKLLNVEDPSRPGAVLNKALFTERAFDADGSLLPAGEAGVRALTLMPLGVYSLNYPRQPLLLVDFRNEGHLRLHEMTQRSINEIVSGVIGISHFANWYYYVGADLYDFYASRHGSAMNKAARIDCYAQFRVQLALDRSLDSELRKQMQQRVDSLAVNPLETAPAEELEAAVRRYALLQAAAEGEDSTVSKQLDKQRRAELASLQSSPRGRLFSDALHVISFGAYTKRAEPGDQSLALLDSYRRVQSDLAFLDSLVAAGTPPEVAHQPARVLTVVADLQASLPVIDSAPLQARAEGTLLKVKQLTRDTDLQADLSSALDAVRKKQIPDAPAQVALASGTM